MLLFCFLFSLFIGLPIWKRRYMNSLFHWFYCGYCVWARWGGILNLLHTVCIVLLYFLCISFTSVLSPYVCVVSVCGFNFNEFFGCYPGFLWLWILEGFSVGLWVSNFFDEPWLFNGSRIFLLISLVLSSFYVAVNYFFFCLYFLHGTITSCREILFVVLFVGSTTNVCMCFLIKILLDYCNKEIGLAILNFFYHIMFLAFNLYYWSYVINIHVHNLIILWYLIYCKRKRKLLKCDIQFLYAKLQFLFIFE